MIILAEITCYNPAAAAEKVLRFSHGAAGPAVINGLLWRDRLKGDVSFGREIFLDEFEGAGSAPSIGQLAVLIADGAMDEVTQYHYTGFRARIWTGDGDDFGAYVLRYAGPITEKNFNDAEMILSLSDFSTRFDGPLDIPAYTGAGGAEGPADLKDIQKPATFGQVFNMEPVLVDATDLIYQVHFRSVQAIGGVYDMAAPLISDGDTTDLAAWTPVPGKYKTDLSKGLIRLGALPAGLITADVQGDSTGGYVSSAGDIIARLLAFTDMEDITLDSGMVAALNGKTMAPVGLHMTSAISCGQALDAVMRSVGGYWYVDWDGRVILDIVDFGTPAKTLDDRHLHQLQRLATRPPVWQLKHSFEPTYRVHSQAEIVSRTGAAWHNGSGAPAAALGSLGDYYLDQAAGDYYEKTGVLNWTLRGNLRGPDGPAGPDGDGLITEYSVDGATGWHSTFTAGDIYMRHKIGANGAWTDAIRLVGEQGPQGVAGADGQSLYTWIAYADSADGTINFTNGAPGSRIYIGVAYNKTSATESADPADYAWSLTRGADGDQGPQGIQGPAGSDGQSLYTWIAYADSADGTLNFTNGAPGSRTYIGLAYNKTSATESSNPADYAWSRAGGDGNILDVSQWQIGGSGSQGDFVRNGDDGENSIVLRSGPYGATEPVWLCQADTAYGADGGWNYDFEYDHTKTYRFIVWMRQNNAAGNKYLGCGAARNLDGSAHSNPYFFPGRDLPENDKWYLVVGILHGSGYAGGYSGISGVYDPLDGTMVDVGTDYKADPAVAMQRHRAYLFYDSTGTGELELARPRVDLLDGNEPSLQSLFVEGRPGRYTDFKFYVSDTKPGTPSGVAPSGWQDVPGAGTTWVSRAIKNGDGTINTDWTAPELYKADYRGVYSSVATYYLSQTVSHQERYFICTATNSAGISGIAPPASNSSNSVWDLLSGKGDSGDPPSAFTSSATHSSGAVLNMRSLANSLGYDGQSDANFTVTVSASITAVGFDRDAIDTGAWPADKTINLTLNINGGVVIQGRGGGGGSGGGTGLTGGNGGAGGHGVVMNEDLTIANSGTISGGSGGGGGGAGKRVLSGGEFTYYGGGGGGGGWPNGASGGGGGVPGANDGTAGNPGTTSGGGFGGAGSGTAGDGGGGGGKTGITPQGGASGSPGGNGGAKGDAIKKNGHTLSLSGSGSHSGIGA